MNDTMPKELTDARLAYANACERMGMAHANGTRKAWQDAEREEVATRRELDAAILDYARTERERGRRDAAEWLRKNGAVIQADRLESNLSLSSSAAPPSPGEPLTPLHDAETTEAALESEVARLRVALDAAADGLRSAATYLRHVHAFAFAEQVEIDERQARAKLPAPSRSERTAVEFFRALGPFPSSVLASADPAPAPQTTPAPEGTTEAER